MEFEGLVKCFKVKLFLPTTVISLRVDEKQRLGEFVRLVIVGTGNSGAFYGK
jgi:hypothetical protein